jgi:hypothetical protein
MTPTLASRHTELAGHRLNPGRTAPEPRAHVTAYVTASAEDYYHHDGTSC